MNRKEAKAPDDRVQSVTFPWLSALFGLLVMTYLLFMTEPQLAEYYKIPAHWFKQEMKYSVVVVFLLLMLRDLRRYRRQYVHQKADLRLLRQQVADLWQSKKQLQLKAHTYSGHADKLKLFISGKLLEHIEYDEKFLHFKSIAAEVRHNGVISFDKVQTALRQAAAAIPAEVEPEVKAEGFQGAESSEHAEGFKHAEGSYQAEGSQQADSYRAALDAMRYLWDLLDLSTADNLALHIGNLLCECEEHLYQRMLNLNDSEPLPYEPVYPPQRAAWRALGLARHEPLPAQAEGTHWHLDDNQWHVLLAPVGDLLGNENHLVLLLENLLKNAQFFSNKRAFKSGFPPISLTLTERHGHAYFKVYNRGPHIRDEDRPNLFQLGFSTRRAREHNGRGLGLYFVNEIVNGYEGRVAVHNIHSPETRYAVRIELENDEVMTELIDVVISDGEPRCQTADGKLVATQEWVFEAPLCSVEVTSTGEQNTQRLREFIDKGRQSRFDPGHPERPHWRLNYQPKRNAHQLSFEPLDIRGVEFEVRIPTAQHRLDNSETELDDIDAEVERLDEHFRAQVTYDAEATSKPPNN